MAVIKSLSVGNGDMFYIFHGSYSFTIIDCCYEDKDQRNFIFEKHICSQRQKYGKMPAHPVFIKTIVTMDLAERIADHYGVETVKVLTGFKFIGEQIGRLEKRGRVSDYICGFEESYGYLTGSYVRDKDAVNAAFMICEMFAFYKTRGISLLQKLQELYAAYGYCLNTLHSYEFL